MAMQLHWSNLYELFSCIGKSSLNFFFKYISEHFVSDICMQDMWYASYLICDLLRWSFKLHKIKYSKNDAYPFFLIFTILDFLKFK